jgi:hypothetical protein
MSTFKEIDREDYDKLVEEEKLDKMCDSCFCELCGNHPNVVPEWSGKDNYMDGWCQHCEQEVTFYHMEERY